MIFTTTYEKNNPSLLAQLREANKYRPWIQEAAQRYGLQPCIIAGLGSRESHWGLALKPVGPEGTGDGGSGHGLMQIDKRWHTEFIESGKWKDPGENILYGCSLLAQNRALAQRRMPKVYNDRVFLKIILASYNTGFNRALEGLREGDIDLFTTGENYSTDVLSRAGWFQVQGWA